MIVWEYEIFYQVSDYIIFIFSKMIPHFQLYLKHPHFEFGDFRILIGRPDAF